MKNVNGENRYKKCSHADCSSTGLLPLEMFYQKDKSGKLDSICKECRKRERNLRYRNGSGMQKNEISNNNHDLWSKDLLSEEEFLNSVDVFYILMQIKQRIDQISP